MSKNDMGRSPAHNQFMCDNGLTYSEAFVKDHWGSLLERQKAPCCDFLDPKTNDIVEVKRRVLNDNQADQFYDSFSKGQNPMLVDVQPAYILVFKIERIIDAAVNEFIIAKEEEYDNNHPEERPR